MFTGLIKDLGTIKKIIPNKEGAQLLIETRLIDSIQIDDSISTNGVCLTATSIEQSCFSCQAIPVTLDKSNLGELVRGDKVNLELSLKLGERLGGHIVQGHVNGKGEVLEMSNQGETWIIGFKVEPHLRKYIIKEGSIAIDGISLTVSDIRQDMFYVSIIPHTYKQTNIHTKHIGSTLNIEVDMMAKYLERFQQFK